MTAVKCETNKKCKTSKKKKVVPVKAHKRRKAC